MMRVRLTRHLSVNIPTQLHHCKVKSTSIRFREILTAHNGSTYVRRVCEGLVCDIIIVIIVLC